MTNTGTSAAEKGPIMTAEANEDEGMAYHRSGDEVLATYEDLAALTNRSKAALLTAIEGAIEKLTAELDKLATEDGEIVRVAREVEAREVIETGEIHISTVGVKGDDDDLSAWFSTESGISVAVSLDDILYNLILNAKAGSPGTAHLNVDALAKGAEYLRAAIRPKPDAEAMEEHGLTEADVEAATIPSDVLAAFAAYRSENPAWGSMHRALHQLQGIDDAAADFCLWYAKEHEDPEGERLAGLLRSMTIAQRLKIRRVA